MTAAIENAAVENAAIENAAIQSATAGDEVLARIARVTRPTPVMPRATFHALSQRQREILDDVGALFANGFAHLTMADIAAQLNCSLRTLYTVAASREELVLIVVDRNLWEIGRSATEAIVPDMAPLAAIRAYLRVANVAVANITEPFANDTGAIPAAQAVNDAHNRYLAAVTQALLNEAIRRGDIARCDAAATARIIAGLGREFAQPHVIATLRSSPKKAADDMADIILAGLKAGR